jgi:Tfp pilus assembly protein PilN
VKAVNLLPSDTRRRGAGGGLSFGQLGPVHFVLAALVVVLAYVTVTVLTDNTISQRKSQIAGLHQQLDQEQAVIARFNAYRQFEKLAQQRDDTVRQIASSRFDWHGALSDLSKVMPADASLQSLLATVAPGASVSGAGGSTGGSSLSTSGLRGAINAPAFEMKGCTATQDDVARLISRLRLINGVQRVTLADSSKGSGQPGVTGASSTAGSSPASASGGCPGSGPGFDLVVFFQPQPGAPAVAGATPASGAAVATTAQTSTTASPVSNPSSSTGATK